MKEKYLAVEGWLGWGRTGVGQKAMPNVKYQGAPSIVLATCCVDTTTSAAATVSQPIEGIPGLDGMRKMNGVFGRQRLIIQLFFPVSRLVVLKDLFIQKLLLFQEVFGYSSHIRHFSRQYSIFGYRKKVLGFKFRVFINEL